MSGDTSMEGLIQGLHHITLVTANQEVNRRFYTEILGLRRVKLTVNQDDIYHRHLFYADEKGTTGSAITFFEWPELSPGKIGLASPHHLAYAVPKVDALPKWKAWLSSHGVPVQGPLIRDDRLSLYLRDPDGVIVEITAPNAEGVFPAYLQHVGDGPDNLNQITSDMKLTSFNHATPVSSDASLTARFFDKFLGLKNMYTRPNPDQSGTHLVAIGNDERPDFLRYLFTPNPRDGDVGVGSIHHIAVAVEDDEAQRKVLRRLNIAGVPNSNIVDRFWFKSLYFRDPDGNLLEVATKGPGYTADEPLESLGSRLVLPAWLEPRRKDIEAVLHTSDKQNAPSWPPKYTSVPSTPETLAG